MSRILGIDLSTKQIDCALLDTDSDRAEWRCYDIRAPDAFQAARLVRETLPPRFGWLDEGCIMAAIENPYSRNRGTVKALARIQGAVLACLPVEIDVWELSPNEWKEWSVGSAKATKGRVQTWASVQSDSDHLLTEDQADAYAIAWACRAMCDQAARRSA